ncbi:cytochrome c3 family protein [uncultured Helicobacter sp.]|uniref:cytochrome c3 family protein n=1 Tax=uncultured Helicobacter sp. TaxID=175537 RepID=UPI00374E4D41
MGKYLQSVIVVFFVLVSALLADSASARVTPQGDGIKPRTLRDYVTQEKDFYDLIKKKHPVFKYQKDGRLVGDLAISDRQEEFVEFSGGPDYAKKVNQEIVSVTYRLGFESILDYPNKFVGPKKCGECHPAQYAVWERSRHSKVVRFPDELEEVGGDPKRKMYGSQSSILPEGIYPDDVYAIIGTPRTKYGFLDRWLVRGTYHVEGGKLGDVTGKIVAGGNQFSRLWSESLTPEVAKKIATFSPGFPTKLEDFGAQGSNVWGTNSYGSTNRGKFMFQPASSYCETCHSFKFDFKSKTEFFNAIGNAQELRKHTISKGISCEECHGAGAHLYGARGAGMPSNCERCHQRFAYNEADSQLNNRKPFNVYFKSACPSCGTEGSQMYSTAHYDKGMRCNTCHDPHEVTANDWRDPYTKVGLKKTCTDCHETQQTFFKQGGIHAKDNCTACHMPNMMSCENFASIQNPDKAGFDNVRASHIWKIKVDKSAKTINPPEGKPRDPRSVKGWTIARGEDGRFFLDLMWSCGRTSFSDVNLVGPGASGCHSAVQSTLPDKLKYTDQSQIYDDVMKWQTPVKEGFTKTQEMIKKIDKDLLDNTKLSIEQKSRVILLAKQAQDILDRIEKDGSWGVHGPAYSKKIINEALIYAQQAQDIVSGKSK